MNTCTSSERKNCNNLLSDNRIFNLILQDDGNLVLYKRESSGVKPIWATGTNGKGKGPYNIYLQGDGNLVIYDSTDSPIWATGTNGRGTEPYTLVINDSGIINLIDNSNIIIWKNVDSLEKIPETIPSTMSLFFMPFLTNAFNVITGNPINEYLTYRINVIKQLKLLSTEKYNAILNAIINFLNNNRKYIDTMHKSYNNLDGKGDENSEPPSDTSTGHITGDLQEEILQKSIISEDNEPLFKNLKNPIDETMKSPYSILESIILYNYADADDFKKLYYSEETFKKYIKYKNKYLNLKEQLKRINLI
jgi:hypothetical protein